MTTHNITNSLHSLNCPHQSQLLSNQYCHIVAMMWPCQACTSMSRLVEVWVAEHEKATLITYVSAHMNSLCTLIAPLLYLSSHPGHAGRTEPASPAAAGLSVFNLHVLPLGSERGQGQVSRPAEVQLCPPHGALTPGPGPHLQSHGWTPTEQGDAVRCTGTQKPQDTRTTK